MTDPKIEQIAQLLRERNAIDEKVASSGTHAPGFARRASQIVAEMCARMNRPGTGIDAGFGDMSIRRLRIAVSAAWKLSAVYLPAAFKAPPVRLSLTPRGTSPGETECRA